jgi:endonuclease/exonuclease/phosphatase family metal-dependent hydrolase
MADILTPRQFPAGTRDPRALRLISYNIQAAIGAKATSHYVTRLHRQFLHVKAKDTTLAAIGEGIEPYDIACIQEIDLGGRRSGFESQIKGLFAASSYSDAAYQENRVVRRISRHGNVIFARTELDHVHDLKLPARMGGRGALMAEFPVSATENMMIVNLHLSLGLEDQTYQVEHLIEELKDEEHIVVCGDFNALSNSPTVGHLLAELKLKLAGPPRPTYPAWRPRQALDHILVSRHIEAENYEVLDVGLSDHLPVSVTLRV